MHELPRVRSAQSRPVYDILFLLLFVLAKKKTFYWNSSIDLRGLGIFGSYESALADAICLMHGVFLSSFCSFSVSALPATSTFRSHSVLGVLLLLWCPGEPNFVL